VFSGFRRVGPFITHRITGWQVQVNLLSRSELQTGKHGEFVLAGSSLLIKDEPEKEKGAGKGVMGCSTSSDVFTQRWSATKGGRFTVRRHYGGRVHN